MENNKQNAMLAVTTIDEDTGNTILVHIPMTLDAQFIDVLLNCGSNCENKESIYFELPIGADEYWKQLWTDMRSDKIDNTEL